jgi:hypothetical protein
MKKLLTLVFLLFFLTLKTFSQTISVGSYAEEIARMNQLLGITDDLSSFTQHPLNSAFNGEGDSTLQSMVASKNLVPKFTLFGIPSSIKILPFTFLTDYNSKLPFGYNNGPLYPNVGYQTEVTGGIFIKAGILNIQFKPELVHAENAPFLTFADVQANYKSGLIQAFYLTINGIDAPERFGPYGLSYAGLGQSKITFNFKNIEAGVSTENLWWGPGVQNSIMMSNSAPGFLHWTFNSIHPAKTPIGSFEWQIIGGILKQSGYLPYDPGKLVYGSDADYIPKPRVSRYLSGFTVNWQPKWLPGFYVGASGFDYMNRDSSYSNRSLFKRIIPVFAPSSNQENSQITGTSAGNGDGEDFAYAINFRQVFPQYGAEIYFEYAKNDNVANFRDLIVEPEQATAYTFGAGRVFPLKKKNTYIRLRMELTHLQIPDNFLIRLEGPWYLHGFANPKDGYSNEGRYLGAGIGPGSNSLMFDASYVAGLSSFGIKFERFVHDNDLYYRAFEGTTNFVSNWVEFSNTFYANMKFKKYLISAEYTPISSLNYEYLQHNDISNKHARITLTYFFD